MANDNYKNGVLTKAGKQKKKEKEELFMTASAKTVKSRTKAALNRAKKIPVATKASEAANTRKAIAANAKQAKLRAKYGRAEEN